MAHKLLLIDDESDILKILKLRLEANDYAVITAEDGEAGMQALQAERPDLVVLDVMMPRMDGFTFVSELKKMQEFRHIPVIMLTAKEMMADLLRLEGVSDYIIKPFQAEQVLAAIKKNLPE